MAYVHADPPGSLECVPEPDPRSSQDKRTRLEMESRREKVSDERGGLATRSDEASQLEGGVPDASPSAQEKHTDGKTKVGKGLESLGGLTADAFQRIASSVGSVAKAPAVMMANVAGHGSDANSPTSSDGTPLEERIGHLETQMTTPATAFNLSPRSHPTTPRSMEKLRTARSLLHETEMKGTLVERVQILEDRFSEYMESTEQRLSIIQSKLAHIDTGKLKPESLAVQDAGELSPPGEEFHDADQGSGILESLETLEPKPFEEDGVGSDVHGEARVISPTPQEALVKEPLAATPTPEPSPEGGTTDKSRPSSEPQLTSSPEEPQNALAKEPSAAEPSAQSSEYAEEDAAKKSGIAAQDSPIMEKPQETVVNEPSIVQPSQSAQGDDAEESGIVVAAPEVSPLTPMVEKRQETPVQEPVTSVSSVEPPEPVQKDDAGKSPTVLSSSEPRLASTQPQGPQGPQGAFAKEPLIAEANAKLEEPAAQENAAANKTGSVLAGAGFPLTSKEPRNDTVGAVTEDKHVQRESTYKAAADVKVPDKNTGSFTSFIMEPQPVGHREKKKKEKKHDGVAQEKEKKHFHLRREEKRQDGIAEEKVRKSSLQRMEEKSKQPFKHLRDKVKHAFKSNKDS